MKEIKIEASTVSLAIEKAMKELNLTREQIEAEIIKEGKKGFLGFLGNEKAVVIIREKKWSSNENDTKNTNNKPIEIEKNNSFKKSQLNLKNFKNPLTLKGDILIDSENFLIELFKLSNMKINILKKEYNKEKQLLYINFSTDNNNLLLDDDARGLFAIQYLINTSLREKEKVNIRLDIDNFYSQIENKLKRDIEKAIFNIKRTKKPYRFRPMPSQFRKILHDMVKENYTDFKTYSEGEGKWRKVVLVQLEEIKK